VTRNLYFDVSEITAPISQTSSPQTQQELAAAMRRIGLDRMLFGSDGEDPLRSWRSLVAFVPLSEQEFRSVAGNIAPYLKAN
jgi:predicted TIM-barrel fold metal-dependent hydrolase